MADKVIKVDFSEIYTFLEKLNDAAKGEFKKEIPLLMERIGVKFLQLVQDEIIRKKVMDTTLLLHSFQRGDGDNIWVWDDGRLRLEVGTNVKYASYVNDGHYTCKEGEIGRFVPGMWQGKKFVYQKGAKTGMYLKQRWVNGKHYWESAWKLLEDVYPDMCERILEKWIDDYFGA